ncbi:hypothetical protein BDF19DRAFT_495576 [Syncephalis fuscata]|nr:hypothetical protein BDF19DRAFT_495576 [Syncephalis fuscata]
MPAITKCALSCLNTLIAATTNILQNYKYLDFFKRLMMLARINLILPLLVLLSVGQSMAVLPRILNKQKATAPVGEYELNQPGAFGDKGLIIKSRPTEHSNGYVMKAKYFAENNRILIGEVICRKKEAANYFPSIYTMYTLYTGDHNIPQDISPSQPFYHAIKLLPTKKEDKCYFIVKPECKEKLSSRIDNGFTSRQEGLILFSELVTIIRNMKAKDWTISEAIESDACITNNHIVFTTVDRVRSIKNLISDRANDYEILNINILLWKNLIEFYMKTQSSNAFSEALQYIENIYWDLGIIVDNPPTSSPLYKAYRANAARNRQMALSRGENPVVAPLPRDQQLNKRDSLASLLRFKQKRPEGFTN